MIEINDVNLVLSCCFLSLSPKEKDKDNSDSKLNSVDTQTVSTSSLIFSWKQVFSSNKCHDNKTTMTTWFLICD